MPFSLPLAYCSHINAVTGKHLCHNALFVCSGAICLSCSFPARTYSRRNSTATQSNRSKEEREQEQPAAGNLQVTDPGNNRGNCRLVRVTDDDLSSSLRHRYERSYVHEDKRGERRTGLMFYTLGLYLIVAVERISTNIYSKTCRRRSDTTCCRTDGLLPQKEKQKEESTELCVVMATHTSPFAGGT